MDNLALNQLKECEAKAEASLDSGRHVTKDKEAAVRVVDVFESVEGRDDGSGQGAVCWSYNLAFGLVGMDEVAAHE